MPKYDISGAPAIALGAEWYPGASAGGFVGNIGLTAAFEYGFGFNSSYKTPPAGEEAKKYSTKAYQYALGLRYRIPFGGSELGIGVQYGAQVFSVDLPPPTLETPGVPDVAYNFVRPSLNARIALADSVALTLGLGYLVVLSAGEIISTDADGYFPKSTSSVWGIDGNIGAAIKVAGPFEVRPAIDLRHYGFTFKPAADDRFQATAASDNYFGLSLTGALRF